MEREEGYKKKIAKLQKEIIRLEKAFVIHQETIKKLNDKIENLEYEYEMASR